MGKNIDFISPLIAWPASPSILWIASPLQFALRAVSASSNLCPWFHKRCKLYLGEMISFPQFILSQEVRVKFRYLLLRSNSSSVICTARPNTPTWRSPNPNYHHGSWSNEWNKTFIIYGTIHCLWCSMNGKVIYGRRSKGDQINIANGR